MEEYSLSVVIPTYKESKNIKELVYRLLPEPTSITPNLLNLFLRMNIYIVEDLSNETLKMSKIVEELKLNGFNISMYIRRHKKGLSSAILDGIIQTPATAETNLVVVMDGDLQHRPEDIPKLVCPFLDDIYPDIVVGCRKEIKKWSLDRRFISKGATLLASGLSNCSDPMSGFFCTKKEIVLNHLDKINPIGYKFALELMTKCHLEPYEVNIDFDERKYGESKLDLFQIFLYLCHLLFLYWFVVSNSSFVKTTSNQLDKLNKILHKKKWYPK